MSSRNKNSAEMKHPLPLDEQLCFTLYSASLAMTQLYKPLLDPIGLTYPQYLVMLILWEKDGLTLKQIGARLGQKSGALTPVLKRLQEDDLITREKSKSDERALDIHLTAKGHALSEKAAGIGPCVLDASAMAVDDLIHLRETLARLRGNLLDAHI
ncbi:DNA-binding transcriptional regulator, MarR family [Cohaesibacter sp. ES.047]|uniref:MarR family winged helix-turn-helix transcriptional regulator n=1 Tax=Cohaesibacter sp. ES.047 TaxID=1798205 RepID=UPI000BB91D02|nr:MarR family transcriptional regulator [Cohaesibacter sp. ES.047]SNY92420.1 DNA-binding transcriptional regulator, MarR family [Cohaesibacter sp. ES.047]